MCGNFQKSSNNLVQNSSDDIWDDRLLIKAYEQAIQLQSADIAKGIAGDTNKKTASNGEKSADMSTEDVESDETSTVKVGDYVRATYDVDSIDYEAQIVSINEECGTCVVKFIGYDNEQTVQLVDLVDSWGEGEQQKQELEAAAAETEASNDDSDDNSYAKELYRTYELNASSLKMPPMPPMPPMMKSTLGEDSEHFSAMLMSWYMSGYYTGLYQGHKLAKQQQNKQSLKRK